MIGQLTLRRILPTLTWCILVLAGVIFLSCTASNRASGPVTNRLLPLNTFLFKNDLVPDEYAGRYVVAPNGVPAKAILRPQDVGPLPVLPTSLPSGVYFSVAVASNEIADGLNAGMPAFLCSKEGTPLATVQVVVVRCDAEAVGVTCSGLISVPDKQASELAAKDIKKQSDAKEFKLALRCKP